MVAPPGDFDNFAKSDQFLALDDLVAQYGPNIQKYRPENSWWKAEDGKIYGIPCRYAEMADISFTIRQDWLDNLGLGMPTTLDELYEVAKAFTFQDPDGNGQNDTYAFGQSKDYAHTWELFLGAYGVQRGQWNLVDGDLIWWGARPETLEAIKLYRQYYQEGLVEPEFPLLSRSEFLNRMNADKYGIVYFQPTQMTAETSDQWREFITNVPHAVIGTIPPIAKEASSSPAYPGVSETQFIHQVIFSKSEHPEKCVELLDYLISDEGTELVTFGIPGEHWDDKDGKVVTREMTPDEMKAIGIGLYAWMCRQKYYPRNTSELAMEAIETYMPYVVRSPMPYQTAAEQKYGPTLKEDYTASMIPQMVVDKDIDVDSVWADYVNTWDTTGGREMAEAVNAEYKLLQSK